MSEMGDYDRPEPPDVAGEAATLLGFLDFQRATLEWKCSHLTDEQMRATFPPSSMTLGGLVKHAAWVEDIWCTKVIGDKPLPEPWASANRMHGNAEWEWVTAADQTRAELLAMWRESVERSRAIINAELADGEAEGLARTHLTARTQRPVTLRYILVHLIEEYARHNGHADLFREAIDGQTGE